MTEDKTMELAGNRASSTQLKAGLPIFFRQLSGILRLERSAVTKHADGGQKAVNGANGANEAAMALAAGKPEEAQIAIAAGLHGVELQRLGYTLSHVVHAYGAICQSITELASKKNFAIAASEFRDFNQCLDVGIAGAVTAYQAKKNSQIDSDEVQHLGFLAHEMRNALTTASISFQLIKRGTVGISGSTGQILEKSLKLMETLIDRSLTEVRLRIDPLVHIEAGSLLLIVDQILVTAAVEAQARNIRIEPKIEPGLVINADQQAFHSALTNLIQNALKFTADGGKIEIRGKTEGSNVVVEVEDECGGLNSDTAQDLFKAFEQQHANRKGLGLGLTIAKRAIELNRGTLSVQNIQGRGCVFKISLPENLNQNAPTNISSFTEKTH